MFVGIVSRAAHTDTSFSQSTVCITDGTKEPFTESQLHHRTAPYSQKLSSLNYNTSKQLAFEFKSWEEFANEFSCTGNLLPKHNWAIEIPSKSSVDFVVTIIFYTWIMVVVIVLVYNWPVVVINAKRPRVDCPTLYHSSGLTCVCTQKLLHRARNSIRYTYTYKLRYSVTVILFW